MSQYRRQRVDGGCYFFTVVTHGRRPFLTGPLARQALRAAFAEVREARPFTVDAIVLLPDHLHTVWTLPCGDADYSTRWRRIKSIFTTQWLRSTDHEREPSSSRLRRNERAVWQRRFYEHMCRDDSDRKRCIDYTHVNPLKHSSVDRVVDWPWSSFHRWRRLGEYGPGWGDAAEWYGDEWDQYE